MTLQRILLVALAALLLLPAAAVARTPMRLLGTGSAWADGDRWAVLQLDGRPLRVIDERTHDVWNLPDTPSGCEVLGAAAKHLLWGCGDRVPPLLHDIETGAVGQVPGWDGYVAWFAAISELWAFPSGPNAVDIGARWVRGVVSCYHCGPGYSYVDWRTGRFVSSLNEVATRQPDLDAPGIEVPLCSPLRRPRGGEDLDVGLFEDVTYERPWLLRNSSSNPRAIDLYRCGRRKPVRVGRCSRPLCPQELGGGYLVWSDTATGGRTTIRAFRLADRRRLTVATAPSGGRMQHTRRTVYLNALGGKVYAAPLPLRRTAAP